MSIWFGLVCYQQTALKIGGLIYPFFDSFCSRLYIGIKQAIKIKHEKTTPKIKTPKCNTKVSIIYILLLNVKIDINNLTGKKQQDKHLYTSGLLEDLLLINQELFNYYFLIFQN